jgi:hypothetical protein
MRVQLGLSGTLANTSGNFSWLESRRWLVSAELLLCIINVYTAHHSSLIFFFCASDYLCSFSTASHEEKDQLPLLIDPLRQGRLNFNVSPVGGITITQAATSRESKEGLYDW